LIQRIVDTQRLIRGVIQDTQVPRRRAGYEAGTPHVLSRIVIRIIETADKLIGPDT